jgi:mono/diheme cytochrome c family protein
MENRYWGAFTAWGLATAIVLSAGTSAVGAAARKKTAAKKAVAGSAALIARGRGFVNSDGCSGCHKIGGKGGTTGPDLSHEGSKAKPAEIAAKIKNPKAQNQNSVMPPSKRADKDIAAMAAYVASLK